MNKEEFKELIWQKASELYREMPWRQRNDPYYVLVSELMLQQTQVERVIPKFEQFIAVFPTVEDLAAAPLGQVLTLWSGLGYNRRAKFLHQAAQAVMRDHGGNIPETAEGLVTLPGVGPNTAGAILAYSYDQPVVFIETNIRTVYFHHFFADQDIVTDKELRDVVAATVDEEHPRQWYWALMDYGAQLKRAGVGRLSQSRHYKKQAPLKGSLREVRGLILKELTAAPQNLHELEAKLPADDRFWRALADLKSEGLVVQTGERLHFK